MARAGPGPETATRRSEGDSLVKHVPLLRVWRLFIDWKVEGTGGRRKKILPGHAIRPFPVALRLDTALQTGTRGVIPASKLIWVSPSTQDLPVKALETMLFHN